VLGNQERSEHIDAEDLLEHGFGIFGHRRDGPEDARVGERDIERPEAFYGGRDRRRDRVAVGGVGDAIAGVLAAELVDRALESR
jgi:hypothetical protein